MRPSSWLKGRIIVEFRCGVMVMESEDRMTYSSDGTCGPVFYVYEKQYYCTNVPNHFEWEWRRDSRVFEREGAIVEATRRVCRAEDAADRNPLDRRVWATATKR